MTNLLKLLFVFGAPRSGTTWIAKIFDSHPNVLYRHEPDIALRESQIPTVCNKSEIKEYRDFAKQYIEKIINIRSLRTVGSFPIFRKDFIPRFSHIVRSTLLFGLHFVDLTTEVEWSRRMPIPDCLTQSATCSAPTLVIKSVSARGRARLFAEALPDPKIVFVLRHPRGQIESTIRGIQLGKLPYPSQLSELLATDQAVRLGLTAERFETQTSTQKLAWHWAIMNQQALDDLAGLSRVMTVRYEDVVAAPFDCSRALFEFADLSWNHQTDAFLKKSTTYRGPSRYFSVYRNSTSTSTGEFNRHLSLDEQAQIDEITRLVPIGKLYT